MKFKQTLILCTILLIITGCGLMGDNQLSMKDFRIGKDGVSIEFLDTKDVQVYEGDKFLMNFMIRNQGAAAANIAYVLLGVENDYVKLNKKSVNGKEVSGDKVEVTALTKEDELVGRSPENPAGGFIEYESELEAKKITLSKLQETLVNGILCYGYGTLFEESVCIQPQNRVSLQPACEVENIKVGSVGQGAPVAVTGVEISSNLVSGGNIRTIFKIQIENLGGGTVLNEGTGNYVCSASSETTDPNKVWNYLTLVTRLANKELKCRAKTTRADFPFYEVRLKDGKAEVICESINPIGVSYKTPLHVELFYDYTQTVTKKLIIEKI